jgi:hypothetical protein
MNVLFDVVHPAQVHFFKQVIRKLKNRGDNVLVTSREKDVTVDLLKASNIEHVTISRKGKGLWGMGWELLYRDVKLLRLVDQFQPDVMVSRVGVSVGPVGKLVGIPTVIYDDMEHARLQAMIGMTFATYVCTGLGYYRDFGSRQVRFKGPPVLSYMSPEYFRPDPEILRQAGLDPSRPYVFIRLVSWGATHDVGREGNTESDLKSAVEHLSQYGRVIISSENALPSWLETYESPVAVDQIHHLLAFASLCLVEGGTMAIEAATLGVPAICCNTTDFKLGILKELEDHYELIFQPKTIGEALDIADKLLVKKDLRELGQARRKKLLDDSEDVVQFQLDMVDRAAREHPVAR